MNIFDAIENGDFYNTITCLEAGVDVNQIGKGGLTLLMQACCNGNPDIVRMLITDYNADVNHVNLKGYTPLLWSCLLGEVGVVDVLINEFSADVNKVATDGMTPLIMAARLNHLRIGELLVDAGAHLDVLDHRGKTAFEIALEKGNDEMAELLQLEKVDHPEGDLPFTEALECLGSYVTFIYDLL